MSIPKDLVSLIHKTYLDVEFDVLADDSITRVLETFDNSIGIKHSETSVI